MPASEFRGLDRIGHAADQALEMGADACQQRLGFLHATQVAQHLARLHQVDGEIRGGIHVIGLGPEMGLVELGRAAVDGQGFVGSPGRP